MSGFVGTVFIQRARDWDESSRPALDKFSPFQTQPDLAALKHVQMALPRLVIGLETLPALKHNNRIVKVHPFGHRDHRRHYYFA